MSNHKQLPLPISGIHSAYINPEPVKQKSLTTRQTHWLVNVGECNHCGSRLNTYEEAFIIYDTTTGEIKGLRCEQHAPTLYVIGQQDRIISVEV